MTKGVIATLIFAGLVLPVLTACQTDRTAYTSLRDDAAAQDLAREREIQLQLATSRNH